ncbi:MAG TPA: pyridoxal-dependent decarboxylase [Longimicrobiales bacterium]|nr:pyridoxal-dependent decarboxylase [Longimicrobiales bacterium]
MNGAEPDTPPNSPDPSGRPTTPPEPPPLGDMDPDTFRRYGHAVIDRIAEYLAHPERWPVLARTAPGELRAGLPATPPAEPEPFDAMLEDFDRLILPATTHWNHPGFFAYFAVSSPAVGILAETLAAALNVNAMLWRTGPAATELEQIALDWLRQLLGLPAGLTGVINDTASSSTLYALAAAREAAADLHIREHGLAGRADVPRMRVYCSEEAHSSVDKAVLTLGLGLDGTRRIPTDDAFRLDTAALEDAIAEDRAAGIRPLAVVATVGTTSTTAIDPVPQIAGICERESLWLHVDAAYGGAAAVIPEMRHVLDGCERADSIVVNPHKWLFVPIDCSALYTRRPDVLRRAFSLVPEYLSVPEHEAAAMNLMDYGVSLGRRFRALKLWFTLRYFGVTGLADRLREHIRLARLFADRVDASPLFERLAPVTFSVVVFRYRPDGISEDEADALNARLLERLNATGEVFLSHTRVRGRFALRLAVGNLRTTQAHVERAWTLVDALARDVGAGR